MGITTGDPSAGISKTPPSTGESGSRAGSTIQRFGLNGLKPMLLEDVGREFGVSRERIRQIQNSALVKMRRALMRKDKPAPKAVKARYADA